jgi:hypothetical protein
MGQKRSNPLAERFIAFVLNKVGIFKLKEMLSDGASIYTVDGPSAHMVFLSKCISVERGMLSIDLRDAKRFARDACQKTLYVSGFDAAPIKDSKIYTLKISAIPGLTAEVKEMLVALPTSKHRFAAQVHGKAEDLLATS